MFLLFQILLKSRKEKKLNFQRANHNGFGAGNFKALFTAIELEQLQRGNL